MITYKYVQQDDLNIGILLTQDGVISCVPNAPGNFEWDQFQIWLAAGNTLLEAE